MITATLSEKEQLQLEEFIGAYEKFRTIHKLSSVTTEEKREWTREWMIASKRKRERMLSDIRTHLIISGAASR